MRSNERAGSDSKRRALVVCARVCSSMSDEGVCAEMRFPAIGRAVLKVLGPCPPAAPSNSALAGRSLTEVGTARLSCAEPLDSDNRLFPSRATANYRSSPSTRLNLQSALRIPYWIAPSPAQSTGASCALRPHHAGEQQTAAATPDCMSSKLGYGP